MEGIGGELGGVALGGFEAAEEVRGVVDGQSRGVEDGAALDRLGHGGGRGGGRAAALGVEA